MQPSDNLPGNDTDAPFKAKEVAIEVCAFCTDIARLCPDLKFEPASMEKGVLAAYACGATHVASETRGYGTIISQVAFHVLLKEYFLLSEEDVLKWAQQIIPAASKENTLIHSAMHRGIDSFLAWKAGEHHDAAADFQSLIDEINKSIKKS